MTEEQRKIVRDRDALNTRLLQHREDELAVFETWLYKDLIDTCVANGGHEYTPYGSYKSCQMCGHGKITRRSK
jgi:hypothetical protein